MGRATASIEAIETRLAVVEYIRKYPGCTISDICAGLGKERETILPSIRRLLSWNYIMSKSMPETNLRIYEVV